MVKILSSFLFSTNCSSSHSVLWVMFLQDFMSQLPVKACFHQIVILINCYMRILGCPNNGIMLDLKNIHFAIWENKLSLLKLIFLSHLQRMLIRRQTSRLSEMKMTVTFATWYIFSGTGFHHKLRFARKRNEKEDKSKGIENRRSCINSRSHWYRSHGYCGFDILAQLRAV